MPEQDPFISVADLEAILGVTIVDPGSLEVKIALDSACQAVRTYLGQTINLVTNDVEVHSGSWRKKLRLRERPVRSVSQVKVADTVVDPENYSVRDHVITLTDGSLWDYDNDNIEITYTHGYDISEPSDNNVPSDIRYVALNIARRVYTDLGSDVTAGAIIKETIGDYSYELSDAAVSSLGATSSLLDAEKATLDPYRIELVGDTPTAW